MDDCELIALITAAACGITKCCQDDDIAVLSAVFSQLGDTLATVLVQREIRNGNNGKPGITAKDRDPFTANVNTDLKYNNCTVYYKDGIGSNDYELNNTL